MSRHWYSSLEQNPYSKWHRQHDGIAYIDVDVVECCPSCYTPLAFIELALDVGQKFKAYALTKKIADKFEAPGFVVFYTTNETNDIIKFRVKRIAPGVGMMHDAVKPKDWLQYLKELQKEHKCNDDVDFLMESYGGTI